MGAAVSSAEAWRWSLECKASAAGHLELAVKNNADHATPLVPNPVNVGWDYLLWADASRAGKPGVCDRGTLGVQGEGLNLGVFGTALGPASAGTRHVSGRGWPVRVVDLTVRASAPP